MFEAFQRMFRRYKGKLPCKVGYVLRIFPKTSETFIIQEMLQLEAMGGEVQIFTLSPRRGHSVSHPELNLLRAQVTHLQNDWLSHPKCLLSNPLGYIKALRMFLLPPRGGLLQPFRRASAMAVTLRAKGITHIHAHFAGESTIVAMFASILTGVPFSFTIHAHDLFVSPRFLKEKVENAEFVVTISEFNRRYLASLLGENPESLKKVHVIHQGIRIGDFVGLRHAQAQSAADLPILLTVARLVPKKGHRYVLEAMSLLKERGIETRWIVVGDGPEREKLLLLSRELGLEDAVEFMGEVDSEKVKELLSVATIFVLPCVIEENGNMDGIPVAIMEAMAAGVPVISTAVSGIPELINDGKSGILVDPQDSALLADAIQRLLGNGNYREILGNMAQEYVKGAFDVAKSVSHLAQLFAKECC